MAHAELNMGPFEKSFNQVKAILGKLDRNIDQLREQRRNPAPAPILQPAPRPVPQVIPATMNPARPGTSSQYGRATPIPPSSSK